jgi:tRNA-dihydrouridine synthase B
LQYITIGNVSIKRTACLGPMASVGDYAFRKTCRDFGAAYVVGEMVSAKALHFSDKKSRALLRVTPEESPMAVQLFGSDPDYMARAAVIAAEYHPQVIDINMGCPVPKVAGQGCGSALMRSPELARRIVKAMTEAVDIPITVKIRKGWDDAHVNAVEFAKLMEEAGASAIAVHGRTRMQMYRPPVDLDIIRQVKQAVSIPVIGNGGVTSGAEAKRMYDETGCDLVMVAQGALGRPWVFREIEHYLETGESLPEPSLEERLAVMLEHISLLVADKGETVGMREARKHAGWYIRGCRGAAKFRGACGRLSSYEDLKALTAQLLAAAEE